MEIDGGREGEGEVNERPAQIGTQNRRKWSDAVLAFLLLAHGKNEGTAK
jgi:hypothetical protein